MIGAALRSSGPLGNELASFWLSETKLMEWAVSAVSTNDVALRPERLPSQGHKVGFSKMLIKRSEAFCRLSKEWKPSIDR